MKTSLKNLSLLLGVELSNLKSHGKDFLESENKTTRHYFFSFDLNTLI
jgi:hypothetical protein